MATRFNAGELSRAQADELNALVEWRRQWDRFAAAPPLSFGRIAGVPVLRMPAPEPGPYHPPALDTATTCVTWYTLYLHLGEVTVHKGQSLRPQQQIGFLGYYTNGAHLHLSLGDGDPLVAPNGVPIVGQTNDITDWLGLTVNGAHAGDPVERATHFTSDQLDVIRSKFAFPLNGGLPWQSYISSPLHDGWEYYAVDVMMPDVTDQQEVGERVYAAFAGDDVLTTVVDVGRIEGVGWFVQLRHQYGGCPPDAATGGAPVQAGVAKVGDDTVNGAPASQFQVIAPDAGSLDHGWSSAGKLDAVPQFQVQVAQDGDGSGNPSVTQYVYPTGTAGPALQFQTTYPGADTLQYQIGALDGTTGTVNQYVLDPGTGAVTGYTEQFVIDDSGTPVTGSIQYQVVAGAIVATGTGITFAGSLAGGTLTWTKYTKTFTDFSVAAGTNTLNVATLGAKTLVHRVLAKHSAAFSGGALAALSISVGITGTPAYYSSGLDAFAAPSDSGFTMPFPLSGTTYWHSGQTITVTATATGDTLDHATAGSVDVYLLTSTLP